MSALVTEPALYARFADGSLEGLTGLYVDDTLSTGTRTFEEESARTNPYQTSGRRFGSGTILGCTFRQEDDGSVHVHQQSYVLRLASLSQSASYAMFRSQRMRLAWMLQTRPDISLSVALASQVTDVEFEADSHGAIRDLNSTLEFLRSTAEVGITYVPMDMETLKLVVYADASYASNADLTSQIGHIALLMDASNNAVPLSYRSCKSKRATRSVVAAEAIALVEAYDVGHCLAHELRCLAKRPVPLFLVTDAQTLFHSVIKGTPTAEKRLQIDLKQVRDG
jgi:hypothetical protein